MAVFFYSICINFEVCFTALKEILGKILKVSVKLVQPLSAPLINLEIVGWYYALNDCSERKSLDLSLVNCI